MKKDVFRKLMSDMGRTERRMVNPKDVVSDSKIILRIQNMDDLNLTDGNGKTLLIQAAWYARREVVSYLLDHGADVHVKDTCNFTALHGGTISKDYEIIKQLLEAGADVNAQNIYGNSPMMLCDSTTDLEVFKLLMSKGANPDQMNFYGDSARAKFADSADISEVLRLSF